MQNQARSSYDLADVHEFPVQHGGQTGFVDDQVAHPEIAVHQPWRRRRGPVRVQPAKRPLECGRGVAHLVEPVAPLGRAGRRRSGPIPSGSARWMAASACAHCRSSRSRPASSRARWMRLTIVSPAMASQIRYGLPSAAGELSAARMCGTGAPAAAARCWTAASSSMPACTSSGGPVRRIRARRARRRPTASNAHVVRLAPPVKRAAGSRCSPRRGPAGAPSASCSLHLRPNPNSRWATRRIWISSAPSVIR